MRAELRGIDIDGSSLGSFTPPDATDFQIAVTAHIGAAGEEGVDLFQLTVCSRTALAAQPLPKGFAFQRHSLVVEAWDPRLVERALSDLCLRTEGQDWPDVAQRLARFLYWEFEDYREADH
jgi:Immunity protein 8